jgi:hypothetical protein
MAMMPGRHHIMIPVGSRFGRLEVLGRGGLNKRGQTMWRCRCDCGTVVDIMGSQVRNANTRSCGCLWRETLRKAKTFDVLFIPEPNSGCWLWIGTTLSNGYGTVCIDTKNILAHRHSWQVHRGEIPKGLSVLHRCDTPACVNPDHLFLGTHTDNMQDMVRKERTRSSLTPADIHAIRNSSETASQAAQRFSVKKSTITAIRTRRNWSHLP